MRYAIRYKIEVFLTRLFGCNHALTITMDLEVKGQYCRKCDKRIEGKEIMPSDVFDLLLNNLLPTAFEPEV